MLVDARATVNSAAPPQLRRTVVMVLCASTVTLLALLAVAGLAGRRAAEREALRDVRATTELLARSVIGPQVDDAVLRGDPQALRRLDAIVQRQLLPEPIVRVKVWTEQGRVVYSDEPAVLGHVYPLDEDERRAMVRGVSTSGLADLEASEHQMDGLKDKVLEVYTPVSAPGGQRLLVETYSRYSLVTERQRDVLRTFLPITIAALVLLQLCQLPLAWSMVRRLRAGQRERELLLQQAITASDDERRRIAGDLHDTVVQGLVGTSYVLSAAGERWEAGERRGMLEVLQSSSTGLRHSVRGLRSMLLEIYPAHIARAGLSAALEDLAAPLRMQGMLVTTSTPAVPELRRDHEALVFRTAQEAVRNLARHSGARTARLLLDTDEEGVFLLVEDDGVGFDVEQALRRDDGHVGLRVLQDLAGQAHCLLRVASEPGHGTRLRLDLPAS